MAIVDHFEHVEEPGFMPSLNPQAARQQFNMSLGLVVVLAIGAAVIALSLRTEPQILAAHTLAQVKLVVQVPQRLDVQQAVERVAQPRRS